MIVQSGDESAKKLPARRRPQSEKRPKFNRPTKQPDRPAAKYRYPPRRNRHRRRPRPLPPTAELTRKSTHFGGACDPLSPRWPANPARQIERQFRDLGSRHGTAAAASPAMKPRKEETKNCFRIRRRGSAIDSGPGKWQPINSPAASQPSGRLSGTADERRFDAEKQKSESLVSSKTLSVLSSFASSPSPMHSRKASFDRLLADNKIEFVPQPAKKLPESFGGGNTRKAGPKRKRSPTKQSEQGCGGSRHGNGNGPRRSPAARDRVVPGRPQ